MDYRIRSTIRRLIDWCDTKLVLEPPVNDVIPALKSMPVGDRPWMFDEQLGGSFAEDLPDEDRERI